MREQAQGASAAGATRTLSRAPLLFARLRDEALRAERVPPQWLRRLEARVLMQLFAQAFDVEPPHMGGLTAEEALDRYRAFTAACMEMATESPELTAYLRERLGTEAERLGDFVRRLLSVRPEDALGIARFFYRGIGIELAGELPGELCFGPCFFSERYTPGDCQLMSGFDEGFMRGLAGMAEAGLVFSCRLTEGAPCCRATFGT